MTPKPPLDDLWSRYAAAPRMTEQHPGLRLTGLLHELTLLRDTINAAEPTHYGARLLDLTDLVFQVVAHQQLHIDLAKSVLLEEEKRRGPGPTPH